MDHKNAIQEIVKYLLDKDFVEEKLIEAKHHISSCQDCLAEFDVFVSITSNQSFNLAKKTKKHFQFDECLEYLKFNEIQTDEQFKKLEIHSETCQFCSAFYSLLTEITEADRENEFGSFSSAPNFGEYYAQAKEKKIWNILEEGVNSLSFKLNIFFSESKALFAKLPELPDLIPEAAPAMAIRGASKPDNKNDINSLILLDKNQHKGINLIIDKERNLKIIFINKSQKEQTSTVKIDIRDVKSKKLLTRQTINTDYTATFEIINSMLDGFLIRIGHENTSWEIPVDKIVL